MSLFQCEVCGGRENTALASQGFNWKPSLWNWSYAPERKGKLLCSACGPLFFNDGTPTEFCGNWHGYFLPLFYKIGSMGTNYEGNLTERVNTKCVKHIKSITCQCKDCIE